MEFLRVIKENEETEEITGRKSLRGALSKYKNEELQAIECEAWSKAVVEKYENS